MGLREGYKQTEVGLIPESWKVATILGLSRQIMDYRGRTPKKLGLDWGGGEIPALSAGNVKMGFIDFTAECYLGSLELYRRWMTRGDIRKSDILFTTEAPLGNVALVPDSQKYILSQRTILIQVDEAQALSSFVFQQLSSGRFQRNLFDNASGSTAQGIQRKKLEQLFVVLPPLHEQRAIAEALSDVDALLSGLDRLIAKKRDLKQAAMQQLLTGQTRLPGFHGEWEAQAVNDLERRGLVRLSRGKVISKKDIESTPGEFPIYSSSVHNDGLFGCYGESMFDEELITWSVDGGGNFFHRPKHKFSVTNVCGFMRVDTAAINYRFLAAQLQLLHSRMNFDYQSKAHPSVVRREYEVQLPRLDEQTAIAQVLSDMDAELAALEARRDKSRQLKQGMMQELLTGRIRLL